MANFFLFNDGPATPFISQVTTNAATTIIDGQATGQANIVAFSVQENNGSTPNLTVDFYDVANTKAYPLADSSKTVWTTKAVTARQSVEFGSFVLPAGWKLRITSSDAAGKFDVIGTRVGKTRSDIRGTAYGAQR